MDMDINNCKICKTNDHSDVIVIEGYYSGLLSAQVSCGGCGMNGPLASVDDIEDCDKDALIALAVNKWNIIHG